MPPRIFLPLYFTNFLNQLDNLGPYTQSRNKSVAAPLNGAPEALVEEMDDGPAGRKIFAPVNAPGF
jgi:hypothetical protein